MKITLFLTSLLFALSNAPAADEKELTIAGEYTLVSGKKFGANIDEESKKGTFTIDREKITIMSMGVKFVIAYKLNAKAKPAAIDMEILEGPEGTKGEKALGIVDRDGDTLKLAYLLEKEKRPKDFDGKDGMLFTLKAKRK